MPAPGVAVIRSAMRVRPRRGRVTDASRHEAPARRTTVLPATLSRTTPSPRRPTETVRRRGPETTRYDGEAITSGAPETVTARRPAAPVTSRVPRRDRPARQRGDDRTDAQHVDRRAESRDGVEDDPHDPAPEGRDAHRPRPSRGAGFEVAEHPLGRPVVGPRPHLHEPAAARGAEGDPERLRAGGKEQRRRHEGGVAGQPRARREQRRRIAPLHRPPLETGREISVGRPRRQLPRALRQQPSGCDRGRGGGAGGGGEQGGTGEGDGDGAGGADRCSSTRVAAMIGAEHLVGVDVGGTFTDAALVTGGRLFTAKVPTTPADQSEGVIAAVMAVLARAGSGRRTSPASATA